MAMNIQEDPSNNMISQYGTTEQRARELVNEYNPKIDSDHIQKIPKRQPYKSVSHRVQWGQNPNGVAGSLNNLNKFVIPSTQNQKKPFASDEIKDLQA
jgi:hypothetical protein